MKRKTNEKLGGTVKPVIVKNVRIGEGNPKIVVPIVAQQPRIFWPKQRRAKH